MPKEEFKQEVEKELTGREIEPWEMVCFKLYKSQIPVVEQAIESAALMLGRDKSRGSCLEMICADFLAGAILENEDSEVLLQSALRLFKFLPGEERQTFPAPGDGEGVVNQVRQTHARRRLDPQRVRQSPPEGAASRWLEMPIVRQKVQPRSPSQRIPEPVRR